MRYVYVHIPETAGASLVSVFARKFGKKFRQTSASGLSEFVDYLSLFDCFTGHVPYGSFALVPGPVRAFTTLRHPVDRVLAGISYYLSEEHHAFHPLLDSGAVTIPELLTKRPFNFELCDLQCRMLGLEIPESLLAQLRSREAGAIFKADWLFQRDVVDERYLDRAKRNLTERIEFGLHDYIGYSYAQVLTDIVSPFPLPPSRVPARRVDATAELRQQIADANPFDMQLFEFAKPLFLRRAAAHILKRGSLADLPGAPDPFAGLHEVENYRSEILRWTDGNAVLDIAVPRDSGRIAVEIRLWNTDDLLANRNVEVRVGGAPVEAISKDAEQYVYRTVVSPAADGVVGRVAIRVTSATVGPGGDTRIRGVPLRAIAIRAAG